MNSIIEEYLALADRIVYNNDADAFEALEQLEEQYPELADLAYQSAGPLAYDFQNNEVIA